MNSTIEGRINFLIENSTDPVIKFNRKSMLILMLNSAAASLTGNENKLQSVFSDEVLEAIIDNKFFLSSKKIFREIPGSEGEINFYQDDIDDGIILIKLRNIQNNSVRNPEISGLDDIQYSESRFRMLFEQSPLLFQIFNSEGDLVKYNKSFESTWKSKGTLPEKYNIFEDNSLGSDFRVHIEKAFNGEFSEIPPIKFSPGFSFENYIWMRGFIYPVKELNGNVKEVVLILENITDQKKIEEDFGLEASYRNAIESSISAGIAVIDSSGRQTYVNDAFCKMLGWTKNELQGMYPPFIYWAPDNRDEIEIAFRETIAGSAPGSGYELKFRKKQNEIIDVLVVINPIKDETSTVYGWLASVTDITKIKNVEKEIKDSLHEKEVLLKEIHHRVKNNLQIISSLLNLQLNYIKDLPTRMIFKESQNRIMSMALVHQKLYLSKNQVNINLEEYINDLIQHLLQSYKIDKNIEVKVIVNHVSLDNDKVVVLGLILNELISNSLLHGFTDMDSGSITVEVNADKSGYNLFIRDNGIGFPGHINFKRASTLGLQLVRTLVEQLNGTIRMLPGPGTVYMIEFKLKRNGN